MVLHPESATTGLFMTSEFPNVFSVLKMNELIFFNTKVGNSYDSRSVEILVQKQMQIYVVTFPDLFHLQTMHEFNHDKDDDIQLTNETINYCKLSQHNTYT
jgi:hypothetical protein